MQVFMPRAWIVALPLCGWIAVTVSGEQTSARPQAVLDTYCITCHNQRLRTGGLALDTLDVTHPGANPEVWDWLLKQKRASDSSAGPP